MGKTLEATQGFRGLRFDEFEQFRFGELSFECGSGSGGENGYNNRPGGVAVRDVALNVSKRSPGDTRPALSRSLDFARASRTMAAIRSAAVFQPVL
jgi:hypothetical protein